MTTRETMARSYYESLDTHDYEQLADLLTADFVHHRPDQTLEGRDRFVQFMREERPMTDTSHPLDAVYQDDNGVAARGRLLDSNGDLIVRFVDVFSFEGEKIEMIDTYTQ